MICMEEKIGIKSAQIDTQLKKARHIIKKLDIHCIEIQEMIPVMHKVSLDERAKIIVKYLKNLDINHIAYHYPIKSEWKNVKEAKKYDLAWRSEEILKLSKETIKEAAIVAVKLDINDYVPVNFHLFRFVDKDMITENEKITGLNIGESVLINLKEYADEICRKYGLVKSGKPLIQITRENNPPEHGSVDGLLDYHPQEIVRTKVFGIKNCLDFAHFQQYIDYLKNGKGELPGADLDRKFYPTNIDWEFAIKVLEDSLVLVHINDAIGYKKENEGLEVGKGEINYEKIFTLLSDFRVLN